MSKPNNRLTQHHRERGFTMIELMTTVLVFAILATAALPSFRSFIVGQRIKSASFDIMSALIAARSEAIMRNTNVNISPNTGSPPNSNSWLNGWTVTAGATILKQQNPLGSGMAVTCYNGVTQVSCQNITYAGNGRLLVAAPSIQITTNDASNATRCIGIDLTGRPRSVKATCT